jgi:Predicted membrane protein
MDWEPQSQLPMDESSPFAKLSQKSPTCKFSDQSPMATNAVFYTASCTEETWISFSAFSPHSPSCSPLPTMTSTENQSEEAAQLSVGTPEFTDRPSSSTASFDSPSKLRSVGSNPFAPNNTPMNSPFKVQGQPRPPHSEFFNPQLQNKPTGPAFRNPAFATPQKRVDDMFSPDSSPAMTDNSPMPAETPETEHVRDSTELFFTPSPIKSSPSKSLFARTLLRNHASGLRDKVRKRKRLLGDKDVGSARPRLPQDSDESDSYYEEENGSRSGSKHSKKKEPTPQGWLNSFLSAISANPTAPAILSKWLQLGVNMVLLGLVLFIIFWILVQVRNDLSHASEKARAAIVNEMAICSENYIKNGCSPKASRPPALDGPCNEWEACMNQDASAVMMVQISAKNVAEIVNEFVGVLSFKAWVSDSVATNCNAFVSLTNFAGIYHVALPGRCHR